MQEGMACFWRTRRDRRERRGVNEGRHEGGPDDASFPGTRLPHYLQRRKDEGRNLKEYYDSRARLKRLMRSGCSKMDGYLI